MSNQLQPIVDAADSAAHEHWIEFYSRECIAVSFPTERQRSKVYSPKRETVRLELPPALGNAIEKLTKGNDTLFAVVTLANTAIVLSRYCGLSHIRLGVPGGSSTQRRPVALGLGIDVC